MPRIDIKFIQTVFVALLVLLITLSFGRSPGTGDISLWEEWASNSETLGVVRGFEADKADYPPYSSAILLGAFQASPLLGVGVFDAIKLAILFFLFLTSLLFWLWTRNFLLTVALHLSLLLNSVALGYIDIFFVPTLILALWALKEQKLVLFTIFYVVTCLIKWQPILIAPFLGLYILNLASLNPAKQIDFKRLTWQVLLPAGAILGLTFALFGVAPIVEAFQKATSHNFLSGNALNFNWIVTHWLHVSQPDKFGGLVEGQAEYIRTSAPEITWLPKLLFWLSYAGALIAFIRRAKTLEALLTFSLLGYLAYFIFNTGVHENHLFLATILSALLFWLNREHLFLAIILNLMSNINLFVFYGLDGLGLNFSRVVANTVDIALLLSIFNVIAFSVFWVVSILPGKALPAPAPALVADPFANSQPT